MKFIFRLIVQRILLFKAKKLLRKNKTKIIAITGSVGKTSTKEAIYHILRKNFTLYRSQKSFNTPIGLCLAILQQPKSGFSSPLAWLKILVNVFFHPIVMPQILVLEMGADHPGDIAQLVKIAKPHISVITHIKPVHLAEGQFKNINQIAREKSELIKTLTRNDLAVLNDDDPLIQKMNTLAKVITYGRANDVMVRVSHIQQSAQYLFFQVNSQGQKADFKVPVLGEFQTHVFLPAIAIGLHLGMTLKECAKRLLSFRLPPGRMNLLPGIKGSHLIDGSYNASPATMEAALDLLDQLSAPRKMAALGSMNELGNLAEEAHFRVGLHAGKVAHQLVAVGHGAETLKKGALQAGLPEASIFTFVNSVEAGKFLKNILEKEDLVLIKGSQNKVRMERCVKIIMKNPKNASRFLCRQGEVWEKLS